MFLPWKLIFQKTNLKYLSLILICSLVFVVFFGVTNNSCSVDNYLISQDIASYEKSLDPEYCENLIEKIDLHNFQCPSQIEILDCG